MAKMVTIEESVAAALLRMVEDVLEIEQRANCSDRYFRTHYTDMARAQIAAGSYGKLKAALEGATAQEESTILQTQEEPVIRSRARYARRED